MNVVRVRAPELAGRAWLNTGGRELTLRELRGKIVLIDFWTFCCINCLHVLDELRPLEEKYADVLVTVGVHSPKFVHEADPAALTAAVERYGVHHPVLDDPELTTWKQYAVRAWPTLVVVDPEGYVVAQLSGEGHAHSLDRLVAELVDTHAAKGTLHRGDGPYVAPPPPDTQLRFPGKVILLPGGTFLISDTGHHSLVELAKDGETVVRRIGSGERGLVDGAAGEARFSEPQGLCLLPDEVRHWVGYDVVVADTVNHALRGIRLDDGRVTTVAGTGGQWMPGDPEPADSNPADSNPADSDPVDSNPVDSNPVDSNPVVPAVLAVGRRVVARAARGRRRHGGHPPAVAL
jgi:thiol-disulfide isomerase/thioredoxin